MQVHADFARDLERELAFTVTRERDEARADLESSEGDLRYRVSHRQHAGNQETRAWEYQAAIPQRVIRWTLRERSIERCELRAEVNPTTRRAATTRTIREWRSPRQQWGNVIAPRSPSPPRTLKPPGIDEVMATRMNTESRDSQTMARDQLEPRSSKHVAEAVARETGVCQSPQRKQVTDLGDNYGLKTPQPGTSTTPLRPRGQRGDEMTDREMLELAARVVGMWWSRITYRAGHGSVRRRNA